MKISNDVTFGRIPDGVRVVNKKILASGKLSLDDLRALKDENVGQIIDLRTSSTLFPQLKESLICLYLGIKRRTIPVVLFERFPDRDTYVAAKKLVDECPDRTLIHCNSGWHRTNLFCEAIQILSGEKTVAEAENSLIKNGFFKLRNIHKKPPEMIEIQMNTLKKNLEIFKQIFEAK